MRGMRGRTCKKLAPMRRKALRSCSAPLDLCVGVPRVCMLAAPLRGSVTHAHANGAA